MASLRSFVEKTLRGRTVKRVITVAGLQIPVFVSPDAQLKYLKPSGAWDRDLIELAEQHVRSDSVVWDIGANVGVLTFAAAAIAGKGKVFAFEPDTFLVEVMKRTKRLNGAYNTQIVPIAISDSVGFAEFLIAERGRASNALAAAGGRSQMGGVRETLLVPTVTGDQFADSSGAGPSLVKIDVEGAEALVLAGMTGTLRKFQPTVYIEVGADSSAEVYDIMEKAGYRADKPRQENWTGNVLFVHKLRQ